MADLAGHALPGSTQPEGFNRWPLRTDDGLELPIRPHLAAPSGVSLRHLALCQGLVCLADFMSVRIACFLGFLAAHLTGGGDRVPPASKRKP